MKMDERRRAHKVKTIPPKHKFAAYCDTQRKAGREKERWSCWERVLNGLCVQGPIIDHNKGILLLWVPQNKAKSYFWR